MAITETKADALVALVDKQGTITSKQAAKELGVTEAYVRRLADTLQKNGLLNINANAFRMELEKASS